MRSKRVDPASANKVIQGLWVGPELSTMERLSIASFLAHKHEYHLYVYDEVGNVPEGAVLRDAAEILPSSMIFRYRDRDSVSGFSNFFRYKLLLEKGGWWVDADLVCIKPFNFDSEYVFSSESVNGRDVINCGAIKVPAGSDLMAYSWDVCRNKQIDKLEWGEVGPRLMRDAVTRYGLERFVQPCQTFCPISWGEWKQILADDAQWDFTDSCAVHLWNEMWRREGLDKNAYYAEGCVYEELKKRYLRVVASQAGSF